MAEELAEKLDGLAVEGDGELGLDLGLKKKKKKKEPAADGDDAAGTAGAEEEGEDLLDLSLKKKKKKKKARADEFADDDPEAEAEAAERGEAEQGGKFAWSNTDREYTYDELLDRVFGILRERNPELTGERRRTVLKPPQVAREGTKKTVFTNFTDLCKAMNRNSEHVSAFLLAELGTSGSLDGQARLVCKGRFLPKSFETVLRRYVNEYVLCPGCKSVDTLLDKDSATRLMHLRCQQCGASRTVQAIKGGFVARTTRRLRQRRRPTRDAAAPRAAMESAKELAEKAEAKLDELGSAAAGGVKKTVGAATAQASAALEWACGVWGVAKAHGEATLAQGEALQDEAFAKLKEGISYAVHHPYISYPAAATLLIAAVPGARRMVYRLTLGRLRNPDAVLAGAEAKLSTIGAKADEFAAESKKLQERAAHAYEEMTRGYQKLKAARQELQRLESSVAKSQRLTNAVLDDLRSMRASARVTELRSEAAVKLSALKQQRAVLAKEVKWIASKDV
ncbi:Eukaryotic translation initiation factor 2 subunit beta [Scenedesmus sp. PABB004]|nr:Eukaryotic translation initiation factor 2 subunit beta [Scenedesmus sp. PABB004]